VGEEPVRAQERAARARGGNILENTWLQSQDGTAILFKSENQGGGCRWCVTKNVTFRYNRVMNAGSGVMLGGYNKAGGPINESVNTITIAHNTFENINNATFGGTGMVFQFADDAHNIVIDHNSMMAPQGTASMFFHAGTRSGFVIRNNVLSGILGSGKGYWNDMVSTYAPGGVLAGNALVGQRADYYPAGNSFPSAAVILFNNPTSGDFSLSATSPLRGAGIGGVNVGVDYPTLTSKLSGVRTVNPAP
jgi:hypothetical protein